MVYSFFRVQSEGPYSHSSSNTLSSTASSGAHSDDKWYDLGSGGPGDVPDSEPNGLGGGGYLQGSSADSGIDATSYVPHHGSASSLLAVATSAPRERVSSPWHGPSEGGRRVLERSPPAAESSMSPAEAPTTRSPPTHLLMRDSSSYSLSDMALHSRCSLVVFFNISWHAFFRFRMLRTPALILFLCFFFYLKKINSSQLASLWQPRSAQLHSQLSPRRVSLHHLAFLLLSELGLSRTQELLPSPGSHQQVPDRLEETREHHQLCGLWRHSKVSVGLNTESESTACTLISHIMSYITAAWNVFLNNIPTTIWWSLMCHIIIAYYSKNLFNPIYQQC